MAKVGLIFAFGEERLYYPECPYGFDEYEFCKCRLLHDRDGCAPNGTYYCSVANANNRCPFDLHKELYGEGGE